jgi:MtaA/CmuA family methyltransferase
MTPRQRVRAAMELGVPDQVPVQCQMATGHILLNTDVDPIAYATDTHVYARALAQMRERYDFDGILMHKPGREPGWLDACDKRETAGGWDFVFPEGCTVRVQRDDDPIFFPASGFRHPDIDDIDLDDPLAGFSGGHRKWLEFKATHNYTRVENIPQWWYACIDDLRKRLGDQYSLHGETRAPFDHVLALLSAENVMMALITNREKVHQLMEWATQIAITWSVAQITRGCDAIKISSPWVGGSFISISDYREFVVPYEKKLAEAVRAKGGFIYTHTCGKIADRLEDMIATGINGIECLDPPPLGNVELEDAIHRTKGKIFIKGNVDSVNTLLNKDLDGVRQDVRRVVHTGAPGGGYICSTACSIAPRVRPENIMAMAEVAREYEYQTK